MFRRRRLRVQPVVLAGRHAVLRRAAGDGRGHGQTEPAVLTPGRQLGDGRRVQVAPGRLPLPVAVRSSAK